MPIRMNCPGCDRQYNLSDTMRGKRVSCKNCAQGFTVGESPGPKEDPDALVSGDAFNSPRSSARKSRAQYDDDEDVRPVRRHDRDEYDDEEPRPRIRKKKGSSGLVLGLVLGGVGLLVTVGVILVLVFTLGSGGKFTVENFKKIKTGMSEAEVLNLIGSPTQTIEPTGINLFKSKSMVWKNSQGEYTVVMINSQVFTSVGIGTDGNPVANLGGIDFNMPVPNLPNLNPGNNPFFPPRKATDWSKLRKDMTEQEVTRLFGQPAQSDNFEGAHVVLADVTMEEVTGPNGKTLPVKKFTYFKDIGQLGFIFITFVDGKVYKFKL